MKRRKDIFFNIEKKSFVDIPSQKPKIRIPLPIVGICNRPHYIKILDPFYKQNVTLLANIDVSFNLPSNRRGIHMSRIEEAILDVSKKNSKSLNELAESIAILCKEKQNLNSCRVNINAKYENTEIAPASKLKSNELINLISGVSLFKNKNFFNTGVSIPFVNFCPCTQRYGMIDFYKYLKSNYRSLEWNNILEAAPLQAHSNRGILSLEIEFNNSQNNNLQSKILHKDLYKLLRNSTITILELLKGPDEHFLVKKGHMKGQFCEDVVREAAFQTFLFYKELLPDAAIIKIRSEVDESIHIHNLFCEIKNTFKELKRNFK